MNDVTKSMDDIQAKIDAERLRADTAEAERDEQKRRHLRSCQLAIGKSQLAKELQFKLTAAEQRIAVLESEELENGLGDGQTTLKPFRELPYGTKFRYQGSQEVWVRTQHNVIAEWPRNLSKPGHQSLCCFCHEDGDEDGNTLDTLVEVCETAPVAAVLPTTEQFKDAFRATGYVTHEQAWELAEAAEACLGATAALSGGK